MYRNPRFIFDFTSLEFLTVFFQRPLGPEVDGLGNSNWIENLENLKSSQTFKFEKKSDETVD